MDLNLTELDDLLEKRFGTVVEADDNLNDETFGDDVPSNLVLLGWENNRNLVTDFDFGSASTNEPPKIPFEKPTAAFPGILVPYFNDRTDSPCSTYSPNTGRD
jgi:hypothetical protein